ncbi:hypothetical protein B0T10DRAFT_592833 [Thelonectria olida]|uniref:Uncharacterized protein n=1 Tax=Thelonectria olida TaxID=1576542 RepID=A0A9P8VQT8_9HYPO|nr:hypothetical protein B0T10DRAFT_592833 [Thelonectria olida]
MKPLVAVLLGGIASCAAQSQAGGQIVRRNSSARRVVPRDLPTRRRLRRRAGFDVTVGVSIKITTDQRLSQAASDGERESAFDSSAVTQFEYTYDPTLYPGTDLYYDVSDINDAFPRQFCDYGVALKPDRPECPSVLCPPDCQKNCSAVYNYYNDDFATHGCDSDASLTLFLCQGD